MVIATSVLSCLAVLAGLTFVECSLQGTLAGSDTPVWLADRPDPDQPVFYTRLQSGIVKQAIEFWQLMKETGGFPIRNGHAAQMSDEVFPAESAVRNEHLKVIPLPKLNKNTTDSGAPNVRYPSILLIVDYDYFLPMTSENEQETIKQRIIYALSFWYSVSFELHRIRQPWVALRITGIVITRNRNASPYINTSEDYYSLVHSLTPMLDYWTHLGKVAIEFKLGSYDIIAHMTDSYPHRMSIFYNTYPGIASSTNPCAIKDGVSGLIVYDDLAFYGLHNAVEKMCNIFGDDSVNWNQYIYKRKDWTATSLEKIRNTLKNANCMSAPKEYYPLGEPVQPILAGELLPRAKQCEAHGFKKIDFHCWHNHFRFLSSTCAYLMCPSTHWPISCGYSNPTLDGTFCNLDNTAVCIAGKCIPVKRPNASGV